MRGMERGVALLSCEVQNSALPTCLFCVPFTVCVWKGGWGALQWFLFRLRYEVIRSYFAFEQVPVYEVTPMG